MSAVTTLKMASGEEVICKVEATPTGITKKYLVSSPMILQIIQGPQGYGLGLIPWVHSVKRGEIPIDESHVVASFSPDKEIIDAYLSQTSGIQLASAGSILQG
jgi:hypothetical protein